MGVSCAFMEETYLDDRTLRVLEWNKVLLELSGCCATELGRKHSEALSPYMDGLLAAEAMRETTCARSFLDSGRQLLFAGAKDIKETVIKADKGMILSGMELSYVHGLISRARAVKRQLAALDVQFAPLKELVWNIREKKELEQELQQAIGPSGEVLDSASPDLARVRVRIRSLNSRLRDRLDELVRRPEIAKYLQEPIVSLRGGRFVVPVRTEYKNSIKGIVHDQSASGATVFIEPLVIVEANNDLREAESAEEAEVERVLSALSAKVGDSADDIVLMIDSLGRLDFAIAKGKYSQIKDATEPAFSEEMRFRFEGARHPLLKGEVVPIDAYLGEGFRALVITGPNTGGKTVALKTMGLLQLMAQAGLHIPALSGSTAAVFGSIFADIGDEQSIEQSLSTFSGHLTNIVGILEKADKTSLVLLDELGAGTDPEEGAALAMAILERLYEAGASTVSTTHYKELKVFAHLNPGMRNASVEFDVESLKPTYRLMIGIPGSSNAFAIAERLGLSKGLIQKAKALVGSGDRKVEDMINSLRNEYEAAASARRDAEILKRRAEESASKLGEELAKVKSEKADALAKARSEAREIVSFSKREMEKTIAELKQKGASDGETIKQARKTAEALRELIDEADGGDEQDDALSEEAVADLKPGDEVEVLPSRLAGTLLEIIGGKAKVAVGSVRTELPISRIRKARPKKPEKRTLPEARHSQIGRQMAQNISIELDLRGMKVEEALESLDRKLDDAILAGVPMLRIIHGKGTGALRAAVKDRLEGNGNIESFRLGAEGEGGDGVTIIKFAQ